MVINRINSNLDVWWYHVLYSILCRKHTLFIQNDRSSSVDLIRVIQSPHASIDWVVVVNRLSSSKCLTLSDNPLFSRCPKAKLLEGKHFGMGVSWNGTKLSPKCPTHEVWMLFWGKAFSLHSQPQVVDWNLATCIYKLITFYNLAQYDDFPYV